MLVQSRYFRLKVVDEELPIEKLETEDACCQGSNRRKLFKWQRMTKEQNPKSNSLDLETW